MFTAKSGILDRIEQTFSICIKNPLALIAPLFIVNFVMISIIPTLFIQYFVAGNIDNLNNFIQSLYIFIVFAFVYAIIYMLLIIPATLSTIKTGSDIVLSKKVSIKENIYFGFLKLGKAFNVYWYMFAYAYLIPALCFIIAGLVLIYGLYSIDRMFINLGYILMGISGMYALVQGVYRGLRSSFAIHAAILHGDYSKEQFKKSVKVTKNNWWRIFGNLFLVGIIAGLSMSLITGLLESLLFLGADINDIFPTGTSGEGEIKNMLGDLGNFHLGTFIINTISQLLSTITTVFIMVFSLIFFMRLKDESGVKQETLNGSGDIQVIDEL